MKSNYDAAIRALLVHEGGNDDDPEDPGGRTSRGIIQTEYDKYRRAKGLVTRDVWKADQSEVLDIYRTQYWDAMNCDELPAGIDYAVFDYGVNSGIGRSPKVLQRVLGVDDDGDIGPETLKAARDADADEVIDGICDERMAFLKQARNKKTGELMWPKYGRGWTRRVSEVREMAHEMVSDAPASETPRRSVWEILVSFLAWLFGGKPSVPPAPSTPPALKGAPWVHEVRKCTGIEETPGAGNTPAIMAWKDDIARAFPEMRAYADTFSADSIPWCGFGLGAAMARAGIRPPFGSSDTNRFMWADSWSRWGTKLKTPVPGCIMVFTRSGGGHVGMLEKISGTKLWVRGFNQSDAVNVSTRTLNSTFTAAVWPPGYPVVAVEPDTSNSVVAGKES